MIKECEFLQHWRLGWSKVPELSLSFGELFSPDGGVVRPWGLGPKLDQTLETWGLLDVHTTFDDEICLSGTRSGQGSTLWALLGGGKSDFGQRNGLKPDPQTDEFRNFVGTHRSVDRILAVPPDLVFLAD